MYFANPSRRMFAGVIVLIGAWPALANAGAPPAMAPLALPALAACDGQTEADITQTPITAQDPAVARLLVAIQQTFDTALAENILKAVALPTRLAEAMPKRGTVRPGVSVSGKVPANTSTAQTLAALANPSFGARDGMAVSVHQQLAPSGALNTDIRFMHQTEAIDAGFNLAARQSLVTTDPMAMRYEGRAMVNLGQTMQFGLAARGTLGTLEAPTLGGTERAGPALHLHLNDRSLSLVSDFGYDFGLNPVSAAAGPQFRARLDLKLSL